MGYTPYKINLDSSGCNSRKVFTAPLLDFGRRSEEKFTFGKSVSSGFSWPTDTKLPALIVRIKKMQIWSSGVRGASSGSSLRCFLVGLDGSSTGSSIVFWLCMHTINNYSSGGSTFNLLFLHRFHDWSLNSADGLN